MQEIQFPDIKPLLKIIIEGGNISAEGVERIKEIFDDENLGEKKAMIDPKIITLKGSPRGK